MKGGSWDRVEAIFHEVVELPAAARADALARLCAGDAALQARIERLLTADARTRDLLDGPPPPVDPGALGDPQDTEPPEPSVPTGTRIGPYRILDPIAQGGMGAVYRAERADGAYEQEVAIKLVRGSWVARELERRFLRERQILARLQHPGIARLLDGGLTPEGSPYLAMELVAGQPLTTWAAQHGLDLRSRLSVFLEVCNAVQYAHRNLVVHRDLKPSNILVTEEGQVRLLDFGIAGLLSDETEAEELTRTGLLALTPEYAAPEQIRGEPATTATDVYALGAILYELLSGHRAFAHRTGSWAEIVQTLDHEPGPLSRAPELDPRLRRSLDGDVETIVRRALHAEADRRYPSVEALADDVRRYLEDRPVLARPDTLGYRLRKFVQRNKVGVGAAAAVMAALVAGVGTTLWQAEAARREARRAEAVSGFLVELFAGADPDRNLGEIPDARELLARGAARADSLGAGAGPDTQIEMYSLLGVLNQRLGEFESSQELLERALHIADSAHVRGTSVGNALNILAGTLTELGDLDSARVVAARSVQVFAAADSPDTLLAEGYSVWGVATNLAGLADSAVLLHRAALTLDRSAASGDHPRIATDLANLGMASEAAGDLVAADTLLRGSLAMRLRLFGERHPDVATSYGHLAGLAEEAGDLREGEALHRKAYEVNRLIYGEDHPDVARSLDQVAMMIDRQGRHQEADSLYQVALDGRTRMLGESHPEVAATLNNLATTRYRNGDFRGAAEMQARALAIWRESYGELHPRTATGINNLGVMLRRAGDSRAAEGQLVRALELRRRLYPEGHVDVAASLRNLGDLRREQGRAADALALYDQALTLFDDLLPVGHYRRGETLVGIGAARVEMGQFAPAIAALEEAVGIFVDTFVQGDLRTEEARLWLGLAHEGQRDRAAAEPLLTQAHAAFLAARGPEDPDTRRAAAALARLR